MKTAIVEEWLTVHGGATRVLEQVLKLYPDADIFPTVDFFDSEYRHILGKGKINPSFIQKLPMAEKKYRSYLPLMPMAVSMHNLKDYDLIISMNHACAKGVKTTKDQTHVSYVHTPMRYAWDLREEYLKQTGLDKGLKGFMARTMLERIRKWDFKTAQNIDAIMANSGFIAKRIENCWQREAEVIYPPVAIQDFGFEENKKDFYLTLSRLVPYKRIDLIVEAFSKMKDKKLVVVGDGPEMEKIKSKAGENVEIMGYQPDEKRKELMQQAKAFVFAAREDFGIVMVEALACGTPVIAYGVGGACEIVKDGKTGVLFKEQTVEDIKNAVDTFEQAGNNITPKACRESAETFSEERFREEFKNFVEKSLKK